VIKIVTDGTIDAPPEWVKAYDIHVIPINIQFGSHTYIQGVDLDNNKFYELVARHRVIPKTSLPSPLQIAKFYEQVAQPGDTILSIHLSSKLSGTFSAVQLGAKEVEDKFKIFTFDSLAGSAMLGYMCQEARLMDRAGATVEQIIHRLEWLRKKVVIIFTVDSLEYAQISGRINKLQASLSSLLQIKPIVELREGFLDMVEKVRTRGRSIDRVLDMVRERVGDCKVNIAVVHAIDLPTAEAISERVKNILNCGNVYIADLSIAVASHLGPRTVGIVAYPVEEV
jgi:DegV family protein with EDD domain